MLSVQSYIQGMGLTKVMLPRSTKIKMNSQNVVVFLIVHHASSGLKKEEAS